MKLLAKKLVTEHGAPNFDFTDIVSAYCSFTIMCQTYIILPLEQEQFVSVWQVANMVNTEIAETDVFEMEREEDMSTTIDEVDMSTIGKEVRSGMF